MPAKKSAPKATTRSVTPAKVAKKVAPPKPVATKSVTKTAVKKAVAAPVKKAAPAKAKAATAPPKVAPAKTKAAPAKSKPQVAAVAIDVKFERYSPASSTVDLVGSFNEWKVGKTPLKCGKDGTWSVKLKLAPGTYEYKFVYDGAFYEPDPEREQVAGPFGVNNLLVVA